MLTNRSVGLAVEIAKDGAHLDVAQEVERLGYGALWVNGGDLDTLTRLTDLLAATRSVTVAPAVIVPDVFAAGDVGRFFRDTEQTNAGRLVVGVGSSHTAGAMASLRQYVDALDEPQWSVPRERRLLAAFGPRKLDVARTRFAGAVPMMMTPTYARTARQRLGTDAVLAIGLYVVMDSDPIAARDTGRVPLRMLMTLPSYIESARRQGFPDPEIESLSNRLVDTFVAHGNAEQIADRVRQLHDAGADHVYLTVLHNDDQPGPLEVARALAPSLGIQTAR